MNNQKDTKKTDVNLYGESNVSDIKSLVHIPTYEFANKKTEKLVTALYMVSDCMDTDDALKGKIRLLGVELLSDIYKLSTLSPVDKHTYISVSLTHIYELLSFVEIANTIGFISDMNTAILKKEFAALITDLNSNLAKDKHFTFTLDEKMFESKDQEKDEKGNRNANNNGESIKDKRTSFETMSFTNNKSSLPSFQPRKINHSVTNLSERKDRTDKIIALIKDKKEISIKDISLAFTNCSEKTIQRELNTLVQKGQLKRNGAKRWSRYQLASN